MSLAINKVEIGMPVKITGKPFRVKFSRNSGNNCRTGSKSEQCIHFDVTISTEKIGAEAGMTVMQNL